MISRYFKVLQIFCFFSVCYYKVDYFKNCSDKPAYRIKQEKAFDCAEVRENCINPKHAEKTRANKYKDRRNQGFSKSSVCGDCSVHKRRNSKTECHYPEFFHCIVNNCAVCCKKSKKLWSKYVKDNSHDNSDYCGVTNSYKIGF